METNYKVLTLHQPWATLVANGIKMIETRPKPTSWNGIYLIHAAKVWNRDQNQICYDPYFCEGLIKCGILFKNFGENIEDQMQLGRILGAVSVSCCMEINQMTLPKMRMQKNEYYFGDYTLGRWAWFLSHQRKIASPFLYRGMQGYYHNFKGDKSNLVFL